MASPKPNDQKIIFTGLDNAGKTSIIISLKENIAKVASLKPTISVERSSFKFLDYEIIQHDLGGQKKYLIKYLNQPDKYLVTDVCIYVIDVKDIGRYDDSLSYFKDVLKTFDEMEANPKIFVFLHKAEDLLLDGDSETEHNVNLLKDNISSINDGRYTIDFRITTIYDIWSISSSFSAILQKIYPPSELIHKALAKLAGNLGADALALFDEHIITLANYLVDERLKDVIQFSVPYFFTLVSSMQNIEGIENLNTEKIKLQLVGHDFLFVEIKTKPRIFLYMLGKAGQLPGLDEIEEVAADFPELFLSLGVSLGDIQN